MSKTLLQAVRPIARAWDTAPNGIDFAVKCADLMADLREALAAEQAQPSRAELVAELRNAKAWIDEARISGQVPANSESTLHGIRALLAKCGEGE